MGRKPKKESSPNFLSKFKEGLQEETVQGVLAILFFVLGVFFILALFSKAGFIGQKTFQLFSFLFGVGYFLLPILFIGLAISSLKNLKRSFSAPQVIGSIIFFISSLGLIYLVAHTKGGVVGKLIGRPLVALFDIYASAVILSALLIISFLVTFDTTLRLDLLKAVRRLFKKDGLDKLEEANPKITSPENYDDEKPQSENKVETVKIATPIIPKKSSSEDEFISLKTKSLSAKAFIPPPLSILERDRGKPGVGDVKANANIIKRTLQNFGIPVEMDEVSIGPSVTRYALKPAEGVKLSKIVGLQNNLELALAAHPVRIEAPIPGKSLVGIEIPNTTKTTVGLGSLLSEDVFQSSDKPLLVSLGKAISGKSHFANMAKMPHLLIAGATGSGKSVTIHAVIASLLFRNPAENLKFIMIDPKRVELTLYNNIPHLLTPVITDAKKAILSLKWAAKEMDRRYDILEEHTVRDIESYHKNVLEPKLKNSKEGDEPIETMPYIVVIIDELADIMQTYPRELESAIVRLAQMSRAVGIHLIVSTQRPSVNVITGLIKANIPARIALQVTSQIDSRTILDAAGAEKLLGAGDMLFTSGEMAKPERLQSAFISETEVKKLVKYLQDNSADELGDQIDFSSENTKNSLFESSLDGEEEDELYEDARETVMRAGKASTSYLQRKLGIGYARAARLIDMLEERGVVSAGSGSKPREVLLKDESVGVSESEDEGLQQ